MRERGCVCVCVCARARILTPISNEGRDRLLAIVKVHEPPNVALHVCLYLCGCGGEWWVWVCRVCVCMCAFGGICFYV